MHHTFIVATLLVVAFASPKAAEPAAASARTITIEELVTDAVANNPELNFYRAEITAAKGNRITAGAWANPQASGELGRKRVQADGLAAEGTAWSVSASQSFEYPGRVTLRKAIANRQIELAELGLEQFRAALAAKVRSLGYALLIAQEKAAAAQEVSERGRELVEVLVQREPAGVSPLLETRIIEASVIKLRREANTAAKDAQTALFDLNKLRGQPLAAPLAVAKTTLEFPALAAVEELLTQARVNNYELRMRQVELAQQGLKVELSKNERWPGIEIGPQVSQEKASETERTFGLGLSVPLPLWNRNAGNIVSAQARQQQAETSLFLAQREIEGELRQRLLAYEAQRKEIARWNPKIVEQLREAAELADRHYRLGAVPVATYVELQEKYLEALEAILATQADALENRQQIDLRTGHAIRDAVTSKKAAAAPREQPTRTKTAVQKRAK